MNTEATYEILALDLAHTEAVARKIANNLKGGEVIELVSDLGGGKTTFVKAVARTLGFDDVTSPSFTIHNVYPTDTLELHHYDFYRLDNAGVVAEELKELIVVPSAVTFIEWGEKVDRDLPHERIIIVIHGDSDTSRRFEFNVPESKKYIMDGVA